MTSRTAARPRPERAESFLSRLDWRWALIAGVSLAIVLLVTRLDATPAMVDRVTIENTSDFAFDVEVTGASRDGWLQLGGTDEKSSTVLEKVLDQGDTWIFHFSGQGEDGGELTVPRAELEAADWKVTVPAAAVEKLRALGVPPTP